MRRAPLLLLAALLAGGAVVAVLLLTAPAKRFIVGLAPVGDGHAALLTRRNTDDDTYFWVQKVNADGAVHWDVELPEGLEHDTTLVPQIAYDAERVYVVVAGEGEARHVLAFSQREDPGIRWQTPLPACPGVGASLYHPLFVHQGVLLVVSACERGVRLDALKTDTGQLVWSRDRVRAAADGDGAGGIDVGTQLYIAGRRVIGAYVASLFALDLDTGEVVRNEAFRAVCHLSPGEQAPAGVPPGPSVVGIQAAQVVALSAQIKAAPKVLAELPADLRYQRCGRLGADYIVTGSQESRSVVVRLGADGAVRWRLDLPGELDHDVLAGFPARRPLAGELGRHAVVPVSPGGDLVTLDLEAGAIVATAPASESDRVMVFHTDREIILTSSLGNTLAVMDIGHGQVLARAAAPLDGDVFPLHVVDDVIWLYGDGWGTPDELPWVALNVVTLLPAGAHRGLPLAPTATPPAH